MPAPISYWFTSKGVIATPGYSVFILPWAGYKSTSAQGLRAQSSSMLGGGYGADSATGDVGDYIEWDIWLDDGTYTFQAIGSTGTNLGISSVRLDDVEKTSFDWYASPGVNNVVKTTTDIAITKANYRFRMYISGKNASSTDFFAVYNSLAWIRTGA